MRHPHFSLSLETILSFMNRIYVSALLFISLSFSDVLYSQSIIINEVNQAGQWVELYNASTTATTNVANWQLCNFPTYDVFTGNADITILSGNTMMTPGSYLVLSWPKGIDPMKTDGELALYVDGSFGSATSMRDYMQYGSGNHQRSGLAVGQGFWNSTTAFVPNATTPGNSLLMNDLMATGPTDTDSNDWAEGMSSQGAANSGVGMPCTPLLSLDANPIAPETYNAIQITSKGRIADNGVTITSFLAEQDIGLDNPFQVDDGGILIANIEDCP